MSERLSDEEIKQLDMAFEDGFRDDYLPGSKLVKLNLGNLFETNPLAQDAVYYRAADPFDESRVRSASSLENLDEDGLFKEATWETGMFWRNSFGFNLEKVEAYFRDKQDEVIAEYKGRFNREVSELWSQGLFDEAPNTFEQWIEGRIFPYTKRWFEKHILDLINDIKWAEDQLMESSKPLAEKLLSEFYLSRLVKSAITLGRMVEHYRWKFQYEMDIVQRTKQFQKAGSGGGQNSKGRRIERLEAFMTAIEDLQDLFPRMGEDAIVDKAFENAAHKYPNFWKLRSGQPEKYATDLRSEEPFKQRYFAVFGKTT